MLSRMISNYLLRRTKAQVLPKLPLKSEVIIYHGLSGLQKNLYRSILTKNSEVIVQNGSTNSVSVANLLNILMQLRKCVLHPYFFKGVEPEPFVTGEHLVTNSGKMLVLDALLRKLYSTGHKVLLFSKFTTMLDIVQDYMGMRKFTYERLDGNVRGHERHAAVNAFNENEDTKFFLLSTLAGGVGLNLASADTVVFLDIDFNPQNDLQALSRCHRLGQSRKTVEEMILKRQKMKLNMTTQVLQNNSLSGLLNLPPQSREELKRLIGFGAERLFVENAVGELDEQDDNKVEMQSVIENQCFGLDGRWPDCDKDDVRSDVKEDDSSDDSDLSMYQFENENFGIKKRTAKDSKSLDQLIEKHKEHVTVKRRKVVRPVRESSSDSEDDDSLTSLIDIEYVEGDVAQTLSDLSADRNEICVLCVDNSGTWPTNSPRLFQSFSMHCPSLPVEYSNAASDGRLKIGRSVHVNVQMHRTVALFVCLLKGGRNVLRNNALHNCLKDMISQLDDRIEYNIHFPRIGYSRKDVNWYSIEKMIKKLLCSKPNIKVCIHYMPRSATRFPNEVARSCSVRDKQLQIRFPDLFDGMQMNIFDCIDSKDEKSLRRMAIAHGASSVTSEIMNSSSIEKTIPKTDQILSLNTCVDQIEPLKVKRQWVIDRIQEYYANK